jgi:hypothetical protein
MGCGMEVRLDNTMVVLTALAAKRLFALSVSFLHALLRTEWQRFVGTPGMVTGIFLVIPAAWLVFRESVLDVWLAKGGHGARSAAPRRVAGRRTGERRVARDAGLESCAA